MGPEERDRTPGAVQQHHMLLVKYIYSGGHTKLQIPWESRPDLLCLGAEAFRHCISFILWLWFSSWRKWSTALLHQPSRPRERVLILLPEASLSHSPRARESCPLQMTPEANPRPG